MDDVEYSVHISERDWDNFFQESEECDLLPPMLAGLEDFGMSDPDDFGCHCSHRMPRQSRDIVPPASDLIDGPPDCEGSPVDTYLGRYGLRSPDCVLSGSEDDLHLESVNRFFEQLRNVTVPEQSQRNLSTTTGNGNITQEKVHCKRMDMDNEYLPVNPLPKGPLGIQKTQETVDLHDLKLTCDNGYGHLNQKPAPEPTDWYTRSMELAATEEQWPMTAWKAYAWKESERRNVPHDNLATESKVLPSGLGTSDPGPALRSDLASHRHFCEATRRGDDDMYHGQSVLRRNSEPREILTGASQSPLSPLRRKKRRKKRMSMEPVESVNGDEGQFFGDRSESDDGDRRARVRALEMDRDPRLSAYAGVVKTSDKSGTPCQLTPYSLIDALAERLPGQTNSRTWIESFTGPRGELSAAGNTDDGVGLPKATPVSPCHAQTPQNMERSYRSPDMISTVGYEKPPHVQVEAGCKSVDMPIALDVTEQMKSPMLWLNKTSSPTVEVEGDKVMSNLQGISTPSLQTCKSDDQGQPQSQGASAKNRPKAASNAIEAQRKMSLRVSGLLRSTCGVGQTQAGPQQTIKRLPDTRKCLPPLDHSLPPVKSSNSTGQLNNTCDLKTLPDMLSDLIPKRNASLNLVCPTCERQLSCDEPYENREAETTCGSKINRMADTLEIAEAEKIPNRPINKDFPTVSADVPQPLSPDIPREEPQTSLQDKQNKSAVPPAHLNDLTTAERPAGFEKTATDKHMQIKQENAEMTDDRTDCSLSKQIIAPEAVPKKLALRKDPISQEPMATTKENSPETTEFKQSSDCIAQLERNKSNKKLADMSLSDLPNSERKCSDTVVGYYPPSSMHSEMNVATLQTTASDEPINNDIQKSTSRAIVKEPCKSVCLATADNVEGSGPHTDDLKDSGTCSTPVAEEDCEDALSVQKDNDATEGQEPPPVFAISSFWNEMEKLTINDILRLRLVNQAQPQSLLALPDNTGLEEASHARDSGYFTHVDDTRPDRSSGDVSTMSDFDEDPTPLLDQETMKTDGDTDLFNANNVSWVSDPDIVLTSAEADDVVVLSTENAISQSRYAEQQYFRKMCKNISMQNLRVLENQPLRQMLRNASVQSLRSLDDEDSSDPFYHINTTAQFSDDESVDGHGFSLSELIEFLFCDSDDSKSYESDAETITNSHAVGTSVAETYDHFFSEFDTSTLFYPKSDAPAGSELKDIMPIFSCARSANRNLQFPEVYDYFFPDSPMQSDEEEEKDHSPPIRVVSRYLQKEPATPPLTQTDNNTKAGPFWTSPLSLRRVRRTGLVPPTPSQLSLVPVDSAKKSALKTIQPINVMGYDHEGSFPDPLLCDLESRIFRKLAEQKMRCPELQTAVADPRIDAPLVPFKQSDMCLVCIAFASWVLKSAGSQGADTWKAVLLANISALSAIRYLRRYVKDEATVAKPSRQIQS